LARAYAYQGDVQKALEHAKKALPQAPDELNRKSLEAMVKTFSDGKNIEQ
jgi:cytochrome c-type biogenesis protein CcmH/NrfG